MLALYYYAFATYYAHIIMHAGIIGLSLPPIYVVPYMGPKVS